MKSPSTSSAVSERAVSHSWPKSFELQTVRDLRHLTHLRRQMSAPVLLRVGFIQRHTRQIAHALQLLGESLRVGHVTEPVLAEVLGGLVDGRSAWILTSTSSHASAVSGVPAAVVERERVVSVSRG